MCYKNFSKECDVSHIGMGVTAAYNAKSLTHFGYPSQALAIHGTDDLTTFLNAQVENPVTHVVIMAQFLTPLNLARLVMRFPYIRFAQTCHSNIGFLSAEPPAIDLIRAAIDLETGVSNFHASGNNYRLCIALERMYGRPITYLPNLYYTHGSEPINRPAWNGGLLKIGCFGSLRVYKNFSTAVAAAVELTSMLKVHSEIWINSGRHDGAGNVVHRTAVAWTKNLPNVTLKELHWASWPEFKRMTGSMNILMQPSYTETFNNVTADGIVEGTPSVVGDSIEWCPPSWKADPDDSSEVAAVARRLLFDHYAPIEGLRALKRYVRDGLPHWRNFLTS